VSTSDSLTAQRADGSPAPVAGRRMRGGRRGTVRRGANKRRDNKTAYLMIAPMVVLLGIFVIYPLGYSFWLSLHKISFYLGSKYVGFEFYRFVLTDGDFWASIRVGLYYALLTVPTGILIALLLASFIKTLSSRVAAYMKVTVYLPAVMSTIVTSVLFVFMYQDSGVANWFLSLVNLGPVNWLNSPDWALPAVAVPGLWLGFGITTLILLAGLLDIPESYYESAYLDGAGFFQRLRYITIPMLRNVLLYLFVTGFTLAMQMIDLPLIMTQGGPVNKTMTPNLFIFDRFTDGTQFSTSYSLAAALLLFVVMGAISLVIFRLISSRKAIDG
jgi:multiple sugar transport system permease protein